MSHLSQTGSQQYPSQPHWSSSFVALEVSYDTIAALEPLVARLKTRNGRLVKQIEDAATSMALNVAEGAERGGKDRLHHYVIALGSCKEVRSGLRAALAWRYLTPAQVEPAQALLHRLGGLLYGLANKRG